MTEEPASRGRSSSTSSSLDDESHPSLYLTDPEDGHRRRLSSLSSPKTTTTRQSPRTTSPKGLQQSAWATSLKTASPRVVSPTAPQLVVSAAAGGAKDIKARLAVFGTGILVLAALLWFSVLTTHSVLGESKQEQMNSPPPSPWVLLAIVVTFLGTAACCSSFATSINDRQDHVKVVSGDSVLGSFVERVRTDSLEKFEPTTLQRAWAARAISEMDRL